MNAKSAKDDEYDEELDDEEEEFEDDEELDDEEEEEDDEDEEEEDEEEEDDEDEYEDDEDEDDEDFEAEEEAEPEDPTWWLPHSVLGLLLLIGLLGFFGFFNKWLGFLAPPVPEGAPSEAATSHVEVTPPKPAKPDPRARRPEGPRYGAKHILVSYQGARRAKPDVERTKDQAKARAAEAAKKAKKGDKFEDLVKEYSDEPGAAARGGNLGRWRKGAMVPQFQTAVEKLKVGDISDPVETPFGFHVIQRTH